ncbi:MAG TPA: hypothetical protein VMQ76_00195 [Terracidiphilus sp.]|nr:hypothetical protein [Terracidiphilus sp.]
MTEKPKKFVVQIKTSGRWRLSFWTHRGLPVSARAAKLALALAQYMFPEKTYRIKEVKVKK